MSKLISVESIGDVLFVKNKRAKRFNISVKPFHAVRVSFPYYNTYEQAINVVIKKKNWILKSLEKMSCIEKRHTIFDENTEFNTKFHSIHIQRSLSDTVISKRSKNTVTTFVPEHLDIYSHKNQQIIREHIENIYRKEARQYITEKAAELSITHDLPYKRIAIRNAKTRWGSCSYKNNLNFSLHIMRLPDHLIDYIILHELAHIRFKDHSRNYWNFLESICPDSKYLDNELKRYHIYVY